MIFFLHWSFTRIFWRVNERKKTGARSAAKTHWWHRIIRKEYDNSNFQDNKRIGSCLSHLYTDLSLRESELSAERHPWVAAWRTPAWRGCCSPGVGSSQACRSGLAESAPGLEYRQGSEYVYSGHAQIFNFDHFSAFLVQKTSTSARVADPDPKFNYRSIIPDPIQEDKNGKQKNRIFFWFWREEYSL
jgi:hypothetical protein